MHMRGIWIWLTVGKMSECKDSSNAPHDTAFGITQLCRTVEAHTLLGAAPAVALCQMETKQCPIKYKDQAPQLSLQG